MIDTKKLRTRIFESGLTLEDMAKALDIDRATFYRKLKNQNFTVPEANTIKEILDLPLSDAMAIFFANFVA